MRFIPTRVHGVFDYLVGLILIAVPWILNFNKTGAETTVPIATGTIILLYSLFTDYEMGLVRRIPMHTHLMLDILAGLALATSPWVFGFSIHIVAPHLAIGIFQIGSGLMTYTLPADCRTCQ